LLPALFDKVIPRLLRPLESNGRKVEPSLVHGDLWYGNAAVIDETGDPIVFDPSSFWAHNECKMLYPCLPTKYLTPFNHSYSLLFFFFFCFSSFLFSFFPLFSFPLIFSLVFFSFFRYFFFFPIFFFFFLFYTRLLIKAANKYNLARRAWELASGPKLLYSAILRGVQVTHRWLVGSGGGL
jgi:hypothetical protein